MGVTVRWDNVRVRDRNIHAAIRRAAVYLMTRARLLCSRPALRIRMRRRRTTNRGPRGSQYTVYVGSAPGQPPMVRTGFGRRSIIFEYNSRAYVARVGPTRNAAYMAYLELGTDRIAPRPWLLPAMQASERTVMMILTRDIYRAMP